MKILIACEYSGTVRDAFIKAGHDAISCDLLESDAPGPHYQGNASKATCLWLSGLPLLAPLPESQQARPRIVNYQGKIVSRWANQTDSGQNVLPPSEDRWKIRSRTYKGIAEAMGSQWGAR